MCLTPSLSVSPLPTPPQSTHTHFHPSQAIDEVVRQALSDAGLSDAAEASRKLSAVAVTVGPGLSMSLRVGVRKARRVARDLDLPLIDVHHMEAHALTARLLEGRAEALEGGDGGVGFPFVCLLVSGGHSMFLLARGVGDYVILGAQVEVV